MPRPPLWIAIHDALSRDLASGRYPPGSKLPTEAELAKRFGVNRHTIRRSLGQLAEEGRVRSRRGAGVFVTHPETEYPIGRRVRFHQNLSDAGQTPAKKVLMCEMRTADGREAEALALLEGAEVLVYEGLSFADDTPLAMFRSVFSASRFPGLRARLTSGGSVTEALRAEGLADYIRASTRITATEASTTLAHHLGLNPGDPLLRTVAVNVDGEGQPVEYGRTWFAGDRVTLTVTPDGLGS